MPRLDQEFFDALRRWASTGHRSAEITISFKGPNCVAPEPRFEFGIWCFDYTTSQGFAPKNKSEILTEHQLKEKALEEAKERLERLERRLAA